MVEILARFTVPGAPRTKKNHGQIVKAGQRRVLIPSKPWTEWLMFVMQEMALGYPGLQKWAIDVPLNCAAVFYRDALRGDAVGYYQGLADVLEKVRVVKNDKQIVSWDGSRLDIDRDNPRVDVVLSRVTEG